MADLIIDVYQGANRKCLAIGNHRISVGKPYGFLEKVESYRCDTKDILSCIEPANSWIPCIKKLPEPLQNVIVCTDINTVTVAWLNGDHWTFADTGNGHTEDWSFDAVKFWMPLPEPPESEVQE